MKHSAALHFAWSDIEKLMEEVTTATTAQPLYGEETGKGLWLVGDHGVYLMPNTSDGVHHAKLGKNDTRLVAYAKECNPDTMEFDDWWDTKRRTFGGDDGVEFLDLTEIKAMAQSGPTPRHKPDNLAITFMDNQFEMRITWALPRKRA